MNASDPQQPTPPPPPVQAGELSEYQQDARVLEELFPASVLCTISGKNLGPHVREPGYKVYLDQILAASGAPKDPIAIMLLEQLTWAHHGLADLYGKAAGATDSEVAVAYHSAITKLMAEFRKTSMAVREYRSPTPSSQFTKANQQNVAANGQAVTSAKSGGGSQQPSKTNGNSKVASKQGLLNRVQTHYPFAAADSRPAELAEASRLNGHRTAAAP